MSNTVFGKTMKNVRKHRNIKSVTTNKSTNQLVSEPNYYATTFQKTYFVKLVKHQCMKFGMIILNQNTKQCKTMLYGY